MKIDISFEVSSQDIAYQMIAAFEGGSTYWASKARKIKGSSIESPWYADPKLYEQDFEITVHDDDGVIHRLTPEKLKAGLEFMATKHASHFADLLSESNADATTADVFLQCCLFKEVVYG
jgi:hypothetical protein